MINIIVNNVSLDLYPTNLAYKRINNAFAFGKLTLNRTQSFKMPKTSKNMSVFGIGRAITYGEQERRYFDAQLQGSGFVENGLIYINSVDEDFTCIFIFGSLIKLKQIADVKKMSDALDPYDSYRIIPFYQGGGLDKRADDESLELYDNVIYRNNHYSGTSYRLLMPSVSVRGLLECANSIYGETFDTEAIADYRIIQGTNNLANKTNVTFAKDSLNVFSAEQNLKVVIVGRQSINDISTTGVLGSYTTYDVKKYLTLADTEIKFSADFPEDIFIVNDKTRYSNLEGRVIVDVEFYGDYSFDTEVRAVASLDEEGVRNSTGEPLTGRTITVPKGAIFSFYKKDDFHNTQASAGVSSSYNNYRGFFNGDASPFNFIALEVSLSSSGWGTYKSINSNMVANLPDISFIDLYNSCALIQGKFITLLDNKITAISYANINEVKELKKVISSGNLKREGLTDSRNNYIKFADSEVVKEASRLTDNYITDNLLLDEEATIFTHQYSEGEVYNADNDIYLKNIKTTQPDEVTGAVEYSLTDKVPYIAIAGEGQYLKRVQPVTIDLLTKIYTQSTQIEVTCYMNLFEYMQIKETNIILYNSMQWVWISANWQKNKAKFVLQKI